MCTDGAEVRDTVDELEPFVQGLLRDSQWGEVWARIRIGCSAWPKQEKKHFKGPFLGNTSHPILWIGNTAGTLSHINLSPSTILPSTCRPSHSDCGSTQNGQGLSRLRCLNAGFTWALLHRRAVCLHYRVC
ncbi:hypothetical protein PTI98_004325 [Pleurotus ostreatus]|nr:hypothetical protein PTI98_004325 [Pleurotus ostreatus]